MPGWDMIGNNSVLSEWKENSVGLNLPVGFLGSILFLVVS